MARVPDSQVHAEIKQGTGSNQGLPGLTSTVETGQIEPWLCSVAVSSVAGSSELAGSCAGDGSGDCTSSQVTLVAARSNSTSTNTAMSSLQVRRDFASCMTCVKDCAPEQARACASVLQTEVFALYTVRKAVQLPVG